MKAAELFVKCLENEGVEYIFGIPGEENIDVMDALLDSPIKFVTTHHEQGAAFMADVYGRLTGRAGVCMSTLGPGATNLITGVADANMDRAPVVAIAGQGATTRLHKESHQILDLVSMFEPITKYSTQILRARHRSGDRAQGVQGRADRKARRDLHRLSREHCRDEDRTSKPIKVQTAYTSDAPARKIDEAARLITAAKAPDDPRGQRRDPPRRGGFARDVRGGAADSGGEHLHGQGRDSLHQRAVAGHDRSEGARPAVVRLREGGRGDLRRLRHGRVPPRHVEPERRQDHRPHRRPARRSGRALHRRGRCPG